MVNLNVNERDPFGRGRFAMYVPPLMEKLGWAELTHDPKGNKMMAK